MGFSLDMDMADLKEELLKLKKKKPTGSSEQSTTSEASAPTPAANEIKGESSAARQAKDVIIATVFVISVTIAYILFYYMPHNAAIAEKTALLEKIQKQESELPTLAEQIKNRNKQLNASKKRYSTILSYFDNSSELEDLYNSVSDLAVNHSLTVAKINAIPAPPAPKKPAAAKGKDAPKIVVKKYKDNRVYIELVGKYSNYLKFKTALIDAKKLLTIHNEFLEVKTSKKSSSVKVTVKINLSTYTIDKKPYQEVL